MVRCGSTASVERWFSACRLHPRLPTYPCGATNRRDGPGDIASDLIAVGRLLAFCITLRSAKNIENRASELFGRFLRRIMPYVLEHATLVEAFKVSMMSFGFLRRVDLILRAMNGDGRGTDLR